MAGNFEYMGDGVYAWFDGYHVWVFASDGVGETPEIALEPAVLGAIVQFQKRMTTPKSDPTAVPSIDDVVEELKQQYQKTTFHHPV